MTKKTVGQRVEAIRASAPPSVRISRTRLAELMGLDRSTVTHWALGRCSPTDPEKVAKILGVTVAELFAGRRARKAA